MTSSNVWHARLGQGRLLGLVLLAVLIAGCAPVTAPPAAAPAAQPTAAPALAATTEPALAPTTAPAMAATTAPAVSEASTPSVLPAAGATPAAAASGGTLVNLARVANFGLFLIDDKGMTLYLYTKDTGTTSTCYGGCAAAWPPLLTTGAPAAGVGVTASLLGTTTRTDGTTQVTYNGHPLYYFAKDKKAGDITGQGVGGVWFVLSPRGSGMLNSKAPGQAPAAPAAAPTATPSDGGGYGGGGYGN